MRKEKEKELNPYNVLGCKPTDDLSVIKKAYHKLCIKYHPDNAGDSDMFDKVNKAWNQIQEGEKEFALPERQHLRHNTFFTFSLA